MVRATEFDPDASWEQASRYVLDGCPTDTWTLVTIERRHHAYGTEFEVYVEPGISDEGNPQRRLARRVSSRAADIRVALKLLGDELRRQYPRLVDRADLD